MAELTPDITAEMDRIWLRMSSAHRLLFVSLDEMGGTATTTELRDAARDPDFRAKVEARVDRLHREVEKRMMRETADRDD